MNSNSSLTLLRRAVPEDAEVLTLLLDQLGYPNNAGDVRRRIAETLGPDDAIVVAELEGRVVGMASLHRIPFFHTNGSMARITAFVVDREVHRRGIGKGLLKWVDEWAKEQGCRRIEVTSSNHRTAAHAFYQAYDYRPESSRFIREIV